MIVNKFLIGLFAAGAMTLLASCGGDQKLNEDEQPAAAQAAAATPAEQPLSVPNSPDIIATGKDLYQKTCAPCHGPGGKGDGPAAAALNPKPRDHTNGTYMDKLTNRHIYTVVKNGGAQFGYPTMPGQPQLPDDQVVAIIAFVRSLSPTYKP